MVYIKQEERIKNPRKIEMRSWFCGFGLFQTGPKNLRETFELITKHSNRNRVIIIDSHLQLKTALFVLTPKSENPYIS